MANIMVTANSIVPSALLDSQDEIQFIVGITNRTQAYVELENLIQRYNGRVVKTISTANEFTSVVVAVPSTSAMSSLFDEIDVAHFSRYVELNERVRMVQYEPNDPEWRHESNQWSLWDDQYGIRANYAWNITLGTNATKVAVIDSGIDYTHEDLSANYISGGYDFVNDDNDPMDDYGHGTWCAGIIGAQINNGKGIAGIAQIGLIAEKCIDSQGYGSYADVADAINHAVSCGARIISMSIGFRLRSEVVYEVVKHAYDCGVLLVAAAGNFNWEGRSYPAAFEEVIGITATSEHGERWFEHYEGSSYGNWVELSAPGSDIYSTIWKAGASNQYDLGSGTSGACPHVAAVAALVWSKYPNMTRDQVRIHLRKTARDFGPAGFDNVYGYGFVDANASVSRAAPEHDVAIMKWDHPSYAKPQVPTTINTTILNYGTGSDQINASIIVNGTLVNSTVISLQSGETSTIGLSWTPQTSAIYNLTSPVFSVSSNAADSVQANVTTAESVIKVPLCRNTIQDAVDAASSGDIILVANGYYPEIVNVWKDNLTIRGEDRQYTTVSCTGKGGWCFAICNRKFVRIESFTIMRTKSGIDDNSSILRFAGVLLCQGENCTITKCEIRENQEEFGYGVLLTLLSKFNNITENKFTNNNIGLAIDYSAANNTIRGNHFYWNGKLSQSGSALQIQNASSNKIYHNNFISNSPHVRQDNMSLNYWYGRWMVSGDYWDNYTGLDNGAGNRTIGDGIGDTGLPQAQVDWYPLMAPWLPGDISHDGEVGPYDFARLAAAWGKTSSSPDWLPLHAHADLNEDGVVGSADWAIVATYFGKDWEDYWGS